MRGCALEWTCPYRLGWLEWKACDCFVVSSGSRAIPYWNWTWGRDDSDKRREYVDGRRSTQWSANGFVPIVHSAILRTKFCSPTWACVSALLFVLKQGSVSIAIACRLTTRTSYFPVTSFNWLSLWCVEAIATQWSWCLTKNGTLFCLFLCRCSSWHRHINSAPDYWRTHTTYYALGHEFVKTGEHFGQKAFAGRYPRPITEYVNAEHSNKALRRMLFFAGVDNCDCVERKDFVRRARSLLLMRDKVDDPVWIRQMEDWKAT